MKEFYEDSFFLDRKNRPITFLFDSVHCILWIEGWVFSAAWKGRIRK